MDCAGSAGSTNSASHACGELTLSQAKVGQTYRLVGFDGGMMLREKINSMGLSSGACIRIMTNSGHGPVGLEVRQTRLGIGRGMAEKIRIIEVEASA
jgi:ferrous iron transport protein A